MAGIPQDKIKICLVGDRAHWKWKQFKKYFPTGTEILDYYHVSEHVYEVAYAQYGDTITGARSKLILGVKNYEDAC